MDFIRNQAEKLIHSRKLHNRWIQVFICLAIILIMILEPVLGKIGIALTHKERILECPHTGEMLAHMHNDEAGTNYRGSAQQDTAADYDYSARQEMTPQFETNAQNGNADNTYYSESDPSADIETEADWDAFFAKWTRSGNRNDDLITAAMSQLGYRESIRKKIY